MKYLLSILFIYSSLVSFSQKINYYNFNSDSLNNAVLRQLNLFRVNNGLDTLVFSKVLHQQITKKHCEEVSYMVYNKFRSTTYHIIVDSVLRYTNFKNDIGNESLEKIGGVLSCVAKASQLKLTDLEKIIPCKTLNTESGQTMTNLKSCLAGAKSIIDERTKDMDFFDKARYYTNLTADTAKCIVKK